MCNCGPRCYECSRGLKWGNELTCHLVDGSGPFTCAIYSQQLVGARQLRILDWPHLTHLKLDWFQRRLVSASPIRLAASVVRHLGSRDSSLDRTEHDSRQLLSDDETNDADEIPMDHEEDCWMEDDWDSGELLQLGATCMQPSTSFEPERSESQEMGQKSSKTKLMSPIKTMRNGQSAPDRAPAPLSADSTASSPRRLPSLPPPHAAARFPPQNWNRRHHQPAGHSLSANTSPARVSTSQRIRQKIVGSSTVQSFKNEVINLAHRQARARIQTAKDAAQSSGVQFDLIGEYQLLQNQSSPHAHRRLHQHHGKLRPHPDRVSAAHPDYSIGAFLDENMRPAKLDLLLQQPAPSHEEQVAHAWDPSGKSVNIYVKEEDRLTLHRHPVAQSTDCIRGKRGFSRGFHMWEVVWPLRQRGTHAVVGVCDRDARMQTTGYQSLVGLDDHGFGWDIIRNQGNHNSKTKSTWTYPDPALVGDQFQVPEKIYCILDMDEGYLAFATDEKYLGVAFRNLKGRTLYPVVCAVWGHCEITMRYMGSLDPEPRSLMEICRRAIRLQLGPARVDRVDDLELPRSLRDFVLFRQSPSNTLC